MIRTGLVLGGLYLLLLIPGREPPLVAGAGREPFAWKRDTFWTGLQEQMLAARAAGCAPLRKRVETSLEEIGRLLASLSGERVEPAHGGLGWLETNLFQLSPLVAACPEHLGAYLELASRSRSVIKRQSEGWDMQDGAVRDRLYRLLQGTRLGVEEVLLQMPVEPELPEVIRGEDEPSGAPAAALLGLRIHSGDILVSRGGAPTSALIARGNDYPGSFSHIALVHVEPKDGTVSIIESHIESGVVVSSPEAYLQDKKLRIMLLRPRADQPALQADPLLPHKAASAALADARRRHVPYDFAMDRRDHQAQFCSEVAAAAYEQVGIRLWMGLSFISSATVTAWLGSLGVRHFETQEPSDLEYDPQLRVVAEWRDRSTLLRAHVDDAVTDVMLEAAAPGKGLSYPALQLPLARLAKAYSCGLNVLGLTGPIPEGMSAAAALRVERYQRNHRALAARVLVLADDFRSRHGYSPPYWELIRLARQASQEMAGRAGTRNSG